MVFRERLMGEGKEKKTELKRTGHMCNSKRVQGRKVGKILRPFCKGKAESLEYGTIPQKWGARLKSRGRRRLAERDLGV